MRIRVDHRTTYTYDAPAADIVQKLRLTPGEHEGQHVRDWRVDVDVDGHLRPGVDAFGNRLHLFYADKPVQALTLIVTGEVEVFDTAGLIRGAAEPLPAVVFLRSTALTEVDEGVQDLAESVRGADLLSSLHNLMGAIHRRMGFDAQATEVNTTAAQALAHGHGVCQDFAHIFVGATRYLGAPARYVSGHLSRPELEQQDAAHAWAEALIPDLGWVGFDPTNCICATEAHLRVAVGLDYLDAAPVRGARRGGGGEHLGVAVHAADAARQSQ